MSTVNTEDNYCFITNFPVAALPKYEEALRANSSLKLSIRKEATALGGYPLPDYMALWAERGQDLSKFWDVIRGPLRPS